MEMLKKINEPLSPIVKSKFDALTDKMRVGTLTETEYKELLFLSDAIETFNLKRATHLSELAHLKGISMRVLANQLGMKPDFDT